MLAPPNVHPSPSDGRVWPSLDTHFGVFTAVVRGGPNWPLTSVVGPG